MDGLFVFFMRPMAEIAAEDIDTGIEQRAQHRAARARGAERRDDLGAALPMQRRPIPALGALSREREGGRGWRESR